MTKVNYKGHKKNMPVQLPIGIKSQGGVRKTLYADPVVELEDKDAIALVKLDPHNFEIAGAKAAKAPKASTLVEVDVTVGNADGVVAEGSVEVPAVKAKAKSAGKKKSK